MFLVEHYLPSTDPGGIAAAARRLAADTTVRHLWTVLIPAEETGLSLVDAVDPATVATANTRAGLPFTRIVAAVLVSTADALADPTGRPEPAGAGPSEPGG